MTFTYKVEVCSCPFIVWYGGCCSDTNGIRAETDYRKNFAIREVLLIFRFLIIKTAHTKKLSIIFV